LIAALVIYVTIATCFELIITLKRSMLPLLCHRHKKISVAKFVSWMVFQIHGSIYSMFHPIMVRLDRHKANHSWHLSQFDFPPAGKSTKDYVPEPINSLIQHCGFKRSCNGIPVLLNRIKQTSGVSLQPASETPKAHSCFVLLTE
jgi:hypothetical protein